ncbi:MAG: hypothetical protein P1U58_16210 [Verrucomicrobiales bacterium]|nr:hypothetical protein [Verrucomicrobiales bacterium]
MKTTLELPDDLLIKAKQVAAQRRTTLKEMVTHSLRRELGLDSMDELDADGPYELSDLGLPRLKKRGTSVEASVVEKIEDEIEREELESAFRKRGK